MYIFINNLRWRQSEGSVETHLRRGGVFNMCVEYFFGNLSVKEFCTSDCICRSYDQKSSVLVF